MTAQSATEGPWHALLVAPGRERRACIWMRLRALEPYWPRYRCEARWQHRSAVQWRSVMPGYLFMSAPTNYRMVEEAPAVRNFLRNGDGDVANVANSDIDRIRQIEEALNDNAVAAEQGIPFKKGQSVWVLPLETVGEIQHIDSRRRVVVLVPMFGGHRSCTVAVEQITAI